MFSSQEQVSVCGKSEVQSSGTMSECLLHLNLYPVRPGTSGRCAVWFCFGIKARYLSHILSFCKGLHSLPIIFMKYFILLNT